MVRVSSPEHWDKVYSRNEDNNLGWFQKSPDVSLKLILKYTEANMSLIEIGAGNSYLAKNLLDHNYRNIDLVDLSEEALKRSRSHIEGHPAVKNIRLIKTNILDLHTHKTYDLWHDRAVFHFLLDDARVQDYIQVLRTHLKSDGVFVLACFSDQGPETCSGLPVRRYHPNEISSVFGSLFQLEEQFRNVHITPSGNEQEYLWTVMRKK